MYRKKSNEAIHQRESLQSTYISISPRSFRIKPFSAPKNLPHHENNERASKLPAIIGRQIRKHINLTFDPNIQIAHARSSRNWPALSVWKKNGRIWKIGPYTGSIMLWKLVELLYTRADIIYFNKMPFHLGVRIINPPVLQSENVNREKAINFVDDGVFGRSLSYRRYAPE